MENPIPRPRPIPRRLVPIENINDQEKVVKNVRSNHILYFNNCTNSVLSVASNQKVCHIIVANCTGCFIQVHDSTVFSQATVEVVNCDKCEFFFDETSLDIVRCYNVKNSTFQFGDSPTLIENFHVFFGEGSSNNRIERVLVRPGVNPNEVIRIPVNVVESFVVEECAGVSVSHLQDGVTLVTKPLTDQVFTSLNNRLCTLDRTSEDVLREVEQSRVDNAIVSGIPYNDLGSMYDDEIKEHEESEDVIVAKAREMAKAIKESSHVVVYTGAGVSTSAKIPDYRGPTGVWTSRSKGELFKETPEMEMALPTYTHYALAELVRRGLVSYIVSTNLDGLHRRSGVPEDKISELHGNCYREICSGCGKEYLRGYNTLKTRNDRWSHLTGRKCDDCGKPLKDTIVHFTENMPVREFRIAIQEARAADFAIVLGTSMNVQPAASLCDKALRNPNGKLAIVNLQHTPYDAQATHRVYTRTDAFMVHLMRELGIENFDTSYDHLLYLQQQQKHSVFHNLGNHWPIAAASVAIVAAGVFGYMRFRNSGGSS